MPAHVQLAQKMRDRGLRVDAGSRLEYLVTMNGGLKAKQYEKIEAPKFQQHHSDMIKLDYYYYLHLLINPLDQVLNVVYKLEDFVKNQLAKNEALKKIFQTSGVDLIDITTGTDYVKPLINFFKTRGSKR